MWQVCSITWQSAGQWEGIIYQAMMYQKSE